VLAVIEQAVRRWGRSCFAFDALQAPERYRVHESSRVPGAVVVYRRIGSVDVVVGEPLAPSQSLAAVVAEYFESRQAAGHLALGFLATEAFAEAAVAAGASAVDLGCEPWIDPVTYKPSGGSAKKFRVYVRRMRRNGVDGVALPHGVDVAPEFRSAADVLIADWIARGVSRRAHLLEVDAWRCSAEKRYFAVFEPGRADRMWALVIAHPVYAARGWHFAHLVRSPDSPEGALELAVMTAIEHFRDEGFHFATFGPYPEVHPQRFVNVGPIARRAIASTYQAVVTFGHYARSNEFFHKITPEPWAPRYMIFHPRRAYVRPLCAAMKVAHVLQ
jgi:lysylphosphatidylglycerol synthetase-like protein (DUF2156 family)